MTASTNLYALTSVTLRGDLIFIPAFDFGNIQYPYDLNLILPQRLFSIKKAVLPFLKFLNLVNFHYREKLIVSSLIEIKADPLLDKLFQFYSTTWEKYAHIASIPERRQRVETEIIKWNASLPITPLGKFIQRYYSASLESTDWKGKDAIWKTLKSKNGKRPELSLKRQAKLKEKYLEIWFEFSDKIEFSTAIQSAYTEFMDAMNQLTFKAILPEDQERLCPSCESDLLNYPATIHFCPQCGYDLIQVDQKYCSACGAQLREGSAFCNNCGKKVTP
jgi:predicted RNA-binding Zn-ribbon protein involved in translation (DUF1610 family)